MKFSRLERLYQTTEKMKASLSKVQAFKFILQNAASKLCFSKLQKVTPISVLLCQLVQLQVFKNLLKSLKLCKRSLTHFFLNESNFFDVTLDLVNNSLKT